MHFKSNGIYPKYCHKDKHEDLKRFPENTINSKKILLILGQIKAVTNVSSRMYNKWKLMGIELLDESKKYLSKIVWPNGCLFVLKPLSIFCANLASEKLRWQVWCFHFNFCKIGIWESRLDLEAEIRDQKAVYAN